jgi:hypothetical protein
VIARNLRLAAFALIALLTILTAVLVASLRVQPLGLEARYYRRDNAPTASASTDPLLSVVDRRVSRDTLRLHRRELPRELFVAVWDAYLMTPEDRDYRFQLESDDGSRLFVDGVLVIDNWGEHSLRAMDGAAGLTAGRHRVRIEYQQLYDAAQIEIRWDGRKKDVLRPLAAHDVSPRRPERWAWHARDALVPLAPLLITLWVAAAACLLILPALPALIRRLQLDPLSRRILIAVVGLTFALNTVGVWWGQPGWTWSAWAPDELLPLSVVGGFMEGFSGGWHSNYPPMHFYLLAWLFSPVLGATTLGLLDPALPGTSTYLALFVIERMASVVMAALTVLLVHLSAQQLYGARAAAFAAFTFAFALPFGFYAKLANPDVPYLFWFALSFWFYVRIVQDRRTADHYWYAAAATLAVGTKDQAYGLYLLPTLHIALVAWRSSKDAARRTVFFLRTLAGPAIAAAALFAVIHNVAFNSSGFAGHVRVLLRSSGYRMYGADLRGQLQLVADLFPQFRWTLGWAGLSLVVFGVWLVWKRGPSRRYLWVLLPVVSYYVTFLAVVGYFYDRFFMPVVLVWSLFAGVALEWLLRPAPRVAARQIVAVCAMAMIAWRGLSIDGLMLVDSRYQVERWLREHADPRVPLASVGIPEYLPRFREFEMVYLDPTIESTRAMIPQLIVVNAEYVQRFRPESEPARWWSWLLSETSPYRLVFRKKNRPFWSALSYESRLYSGEENPSTNLSKINPDIAVFELRERVE